MFQWQCQAVARPLTCTPPQYPITGNLCPPTGGSLKTGGHRGQTQAVKNRARRAWPCRGVGGVPGPPRRGGRPGRGRGRGRGGGPAAVGRPGAPAGAGVADRPAGAGPVVVVRRGPTGWGGGRVCAIAVAGGGESILANQKCGKEETSRSNGWQSWHVATSLQDGPVYRLGPFFRGQKAGGPSGALPAVDLSHGGRC